MNEIIENILNRRSVRVYKDEQIKEEDLDLILKSGIFAPSGCNTQPWHFTVVQNKDLLKEMSDESKKLFVNSDNEMFQRMAKNPDYHVFYNAPTVIIVSGEKSAVTVSEDCAAASENMILAASSLGIGSCWIGLVTFLFRSEKAQEYSEKLGLSEGYEPKYAITLGYKKYDNPNPQMRRENTINYIK